MAICQFRHAFDATEDCWNYIRGNIYHAKDDDVTELKKDLGLPTISRRRKRLTLCVRFASRSFHRVRQSSHLDLARLTATLGPVERAASQTVRDLSRGKRGMDTRRLGFAIEISELFHFVPAAQISISGAAKTDKMRTE